MTEPLAKWAMANLSRTDRLVVMLRHAEELEFAEIGEALGMPSRIAKACYGRAAEKLADYLERRGRD